MEEGGLRGPLSPNTSGDAFLGRGIGWFYSCCSWRRDSWLPFWVRPVWAAKATHTHKDLEVVILAPLGMMEGEGRRGHQHEGQWT